MRNRFSRHNQQEVNLVTFRDLLTACFGLLLGIIVILTMFVNPGKKNVEEIADRSNGNIRVEIIWPNELDVDIDLWCKAPGDVPVGYSNKGGKVFNLIRDDLGWYGDISGMNYEVMFSRGNPPGEYICNVHWYSNAASAKRVPVKMIVTYRMSDQALGVYGSGAGAEQILVADAVLLKPGDELTMARWTLDSKHVLVKSSINSVQHPLRESKDQLAPRGGPPNLSAPPPQESK